MSSPAGKKATPGGASTTGNKTPQKKGSPAGKKTSPVGASKGGDETSKEETSPAGKKSTPAGKKSTPHGASKGGNESRKGKTSPAGEKSTQEGVSVVEKKTTEKEPEGKSSGFESSIPKGHINFNELKTSDKFKEWFWKENNAKDIILAVNDYSFMKKQFEGHFVRYEEAPPHIYGVVINKSNQDDPLLANIKKLGLRLVKVGFTQTETIKGSGNRMEVVRKQIEKDGRFTTAIIFVLIIDFTTGHTLGAEEQDIRRKVGIELDKEFAKWLNLPIPTEWVMTTQKNIDSLRGRIDEKKKTRAKDKKMYTTKDVEQCERQPIEELVKKIDVQEIGVKDDKVVLLSSNEPSPSIPEEVHGEIVPNEP